MEPRQVVVLSRTPVREKLTKKIFMSLQPGMFLASNCYEEYNGHSFPIFAEYVADEDLKPSQWKRICAKGANGRYAEVWPKRALWARGVKNRGVSNIVGLRAQ